MNFLTTTQLTMSSREIADLVESRHDSVKRTIERLVESGAISQPPMVDGVKSANGVVEKTYKINKRDSYVIVAQLSPLFTARLVDRWQELENSKQQFEIPTTLSGALLLAAKQAEQLEQQQLLLEQQKPMVQFVEEYVDSNGTMSLRDAGKVLGMGQKKFIAELEGVVLFRNGQGTLVPYINHINNGHFVVKTGADNNHSYTQTRVTPKGLTFLSYFLGKDVDNKLLSVK